MNQGKLTVVFCTDGIFPHAIGGMQRHSRLLIEELAKDNNLQLVVIHPHAGLNVFDGITNITEIPVPPSKSSGRYLIDCYRYSKSVYEILKKYPGAVVYSQGLAVWYKIKNLSSRVIVNPHGLESFQTLSMKDFLVGMPFRLIFNYLFRNAGIVVSLGGRLTGILQKELGSKRNKIVVLPNAVNIPAEHNRDYKGMPIQFLFVGRFAFNKGIGVLLEAVRMLNEEGYADKMNFNLVGKGPLYDEYKNRYAAPNINFIGFADDNKLVDLYKSNDVFVLPTLFEGMPTVVLEAMCYSMPVIVTDVGATCELVDKTNGYIIEKNDVGSLKEAMLSYFYLPPAEKKLLAERSRAKVKDKFSWEVVADDHKKVFYRLSEMM